MARKKWLRVGYHILFWLMYLPINATVVGLIQGGTLGDSNLLPLIVAEAWMLPSKLTFIYFVFYYLIPLYLNRAGALRIVFLGLVAFLFAGVLYRFVDAKLFLPLIHNTESDPFDPSNYVLALFDTFVTSSAAIAVKMVRVQYKSLEYEQELMRQKLQSELDFLRAQTNPHFLFNTLNNLYGLARKKSEKTPEAILMLSKIMRFMLYECKHHRIPISGEAKVIQDYIELEKLRYNTRLKVKYEEQLDNPGTLIAPLLLLPFVENSFKHGAHSSTSDAEIHIKLYLHNNQLQFSVDNTFDHTEPIANGDTLRYANSSGIGMRNEQRQLDLLYPDRHDLTISDSNGWYRANLKINLSDN
jgi:two-component system, LytTR family, sensor kinase